MAKVLDASRLRFAPNPPLPPPSPLLFIQDQVGKGAAAAAVEEFSGADVDGTVAVLGVARKFFDEDAGETTAEALSVTSGAAAAAHRLTLAAFSALARYVEHLQGAVFAPRSMALTVRSPFGRVALDAETQRHLELVSNARSGSSKTGSLFAVLNRTKTALGERLLKEQLRAPAAHLSTLELRLDCVEELLAREPAARALSDALPILPDIDAMLSQLATQPKIATPKTSRLTVAAMLSLRATLVALPALAAALAGTQNALFLALAARFDDPVLAMLAKTVARVVADVPGLAARGTATALDAREAECGAVRAGLDGDLDATRRIYADTLVEIQEQTAVMATRWAMAGVRLGHTAPRGFVLILPRADVERAGGGLPAGALQPVWAKASVAVTTDALASLNARLADALASLLEHSARVLRGVVEHVRGHLAELYKAADAVAMLDMLVAFAATARGGGGGGPPWVRPTLSLDGATAVINGRHPILEACAAPGSPPVIANSISLGSAMGRGRLLIVTGANASGKSTALRMVGCITILALVGSFVPADAATVRVVDRICSRLGVGDDLAANASTFLKEMREAVAILRALKGGGTGGGIGPRALVLIDELGRGTASTDGLAIAWAIAEHIALYVPRAQCIFVTHAAELRALADMNAESGIVALAHASAFSFSGAAAPRLTEAYGIDVAAAVGLPRALIEDARALRAELVRRAAAAAVGGQALVPLEVSARATAARAADALVERLLSTARAAAAAGEMGAGAVGHLTTGDIAEQVLAARRELGVSLVSAGFSSRVPKAAALAWDDDE